MAASAAAAMSDLQGCLLTLAAAVLVQLAVVCRGSPAQDRRARVTFWCLHWTIRDPVSIGIRYLIFSRGGWWWLLHYPVVCWETAATQILADIYEKRQVVHVTRALLKNCISISIIECIFLSFGVTYVFPVVPGGPTAWSALRFLWMGFPFDLGLDLGFYTFHRICHVNKKLYRLVHTEHHIESAKEHGRLVAYETWTLTLAEVVSIVAAYGIGFLLVVLTAGPMTLFELCFLAHYAHTVELLGHTAMTWTPRANPVRWLLELSGFDNKIQEHTMHHEQPLSNFGKRTTVWDRLFGSYRPPRAPKERTCPPLAPPAAEPQGQYARAAPAA